MMISAIVPVYNGEKYIETLHRCFEEQTFADFEVIYVNDGSTDGSRELLEKIVASNTEKYKVINQENGGVSKARNTGIDNAKGEYITFIDVDDEIVSDYFDRLLRETNIDGTDLVINATWNADKLLQNGFRSISPDELLKDFLFGTCKISSCGLLISRGLLFDNGLRYAQGYKYSEDLHMVWRLLCNANSIRVSTSKLYIYNMQENSAMTKISDSRFDSLKLMESLKPYIKENKPEFYPLYEKYAVPRMAWSLLWQIAHFCDKKEFMSYLDKYDFAADLKNLKDFPSKKVSLSSELFLISPAAYYRAVKLASRKYRS